MKRTLAVVAALAACGMASAQSSVTVFGVVDAAVRSVSNKSESINGAGPVFGAKVSRTELANSGLSSSRLGFRGVEDLGGGLAAGFWLEAPVGNDDGGSGLAFSRRSTVSLSGPFGEIRLGRDKTATVNNEEQFDPFGDTGIGGSLIIDANETSTAGGGFGANSTYKRASNMVQYFLPRNLGGVYGNVEYALHERVRTSPNYLAGADRSNTGRHVGGRIGYANGPFDIAASYAQNDTSLTTGTGNAAVTRLGNIKTFNLGSSYDFGMVKVFGEISRSKDHRDALNLFSQQQDVSLTGYLLGVTAPVGAGLIRASYSHVKYNVHRLPVLGVVQGDPKASKLALGYVHNLSKRTALYGTVAHVSNKNGANLTIGAGPSYVTAANLRPKSSTGYEFGLRHSF